MLVFAETGNGKYEIISKKNEMFIWESVRPRTGTAENIGLVDVVGRCCLYDNHLLIIRRFWY